MRSGFLGEQIPAGYTLHRHALWDLESLELLTWGTCSADTPLCSALQYRFWASGLFLLVFSVYNILKHLHFLRERGEEAVASFCGGDKLRVLFFLYLILGEQ